MGLLFCRVVDFGTAVLKANFRKDAQAIAASVHPGSGIHQFFNFLIGQFRVCVGLLARNDWNWYGRLFCADSILSIIEKSSFVGCSGSGGNTPCAYPFADFLAKGGISRRSDFYWVSLDFGDLHCLSGRLHL